MAGAGIRALAGEKPMSNKALSAFVTARTEQAEMLAKAPHPSMIAGLREHLAKHFPEAGKGDGATAAKLTGAHSFATSEAPKREANAKSTTDAPKFKTAEEYLLHHLNTASFDSAAWSRALAVHDAKKASAKAAAKVAHKAYLASLPPRAPYVPTKVMASNGFTKGASQNARLPKGAQPIYEHGGLVVHKAVVDGYQAKGHSVTSLATGKTIATFDGAQGKNMADRFTANMGKSPTMRRAMAGDEAALSRVSKYAQQLRRAPLSDQEKKTPSVKRMDAARAVVQKAERARLTASTKAIVAAHKNMAPAEKASLLKARSERARASFDRAEAVFGRRATVKGAHDEVIMQRVARATFKSRASTINRLDEAKQRFASAS